MKKFVIKSLAFVLIFAAVFLGVQTVLKYHWPDDTYVKNKDYEKQPENSIDVLVFGTSEMNSCYLPVAVYYVSGITGYNFALQNRSAVTTYYQLKYALKHQTPKLVICDFACLFDDMLPSEREVIYRRVVESMPDREIKNELINEICEIDETQDPLDWYLPLFKYHTRWNELTPDDFAGRREYADYIKGTDIRIPQLNEQAFDIVPELWDAEAEANELSEFSVEYYDKMIEECRSRGIEVMCMLTPKVCDAAVYKANWPKMQEYFESRGVKYINYCEYDKIKQMGLNMYEDYADNAHLNAYGAVKFSTVVGQDLKGMYEFPDRREDANSQVTADWNGLWARLAAYYGTFSGQ